MQIVDGNSVVIYTVDELVGAGAPFVYIFTGVALCYLLMNLFMFIFGYV